VIVLTGATGFLGAYVAARLIETTDEEIVCLVRGEDPQARLDAALYPLLGEWDSSRVRAVPGDLLSDEPFEIDVDAVRTIIHSAADVAFDRPLEEARAINVGGAGKMLALARECPNLQRFVHVSTAYVGGTTVGRFGEDDMDTGQGFRNSYEQSKFEAELLVRSSGLPVRVVRPSIVVGESQSGWTSSFNVLYAPLRAFSRGLVERIPADPSAIVDVVPVDHVCDVIVAAMHSSPPTPTTLHAVAGEGAMRAGELAALASGLLGQKCPELLMNGEEPPAGLEVYAPYFTVHTRFDATAVRALGLTPPPLAAYLPRVLTFAEDARWGKRKPATFRHDARAAAA
jgi:long-chain acyl-CoA synthetase